MTQFNPASAATSSLLPENFRLFLFVRASSPAFSGLFARQMVVIQSGFADGDDLGMFHPFAQGGAEVLRRFVGI